MKETNERSCRMEEKDRENVDRENVNERGKCSKEKTERYFKNVINEDRKMER